MSQQNSADTPPIGEKKEEESRGPYIQPAQTTDWETPRELFHQLDATFGPFDLDPATTPAQYTGAMILSRGGTIFVPPDYEIPDTIPRELLPNIKVDGLKQPWDKYKVAYVNAPYGRELPTWMDKMKSESLIREITIVALLPTYPSSKWWQMNVLRGVEYVDGGWKVHSSCDQVIFLPGRLKFEGAKNHAGFGSCIVIWRGPSRDIDELEETVRKWHG